MINSTSNTILRRSSRVHHPPDRHGFSHTSFHTTLTSIPIPKCYSEVVKHGCWHAEMAEELQALRDNHTWDVVQCPPNVKVMVVNGFIRLSFILMVLSIAIRHGRLSLVTNKSMGSTMRRLLLRSPK